MATIMEGRKEVNVFMQNINYLVPHLSSSCLYFFVYMKAFST